MRIAAVIPAYNEGERIRPVLDALCAVSEVSEIIVVDDGSTDDTGIVLCRHSLGESGRLSVLRHPQNRGKGAALWTGACAATTADILLFLDADLTGIRPAHLHALLLPVCEGRAEMTVGRFRAGRTLPSLSHFLFPNISGQRAICRNLFLSAPYLEKSGFGVEISLTAFARQEGYRVAAVEWLGVSHVMKEEKLGVARGLSYRFRMYGEIVAGWVRR